MKKKISAMLVLLLLATLVFSNTLSYAATNKKGDTFTIDKMKMKITKAASSSKSGEVSIISYSDKKSSTELVIPGTIEYNSKKYKVTCIDSFAFKNSKFKQISIPSSIAKINYQAFRKCTNLTSIEILGHVSLGTNIFMDCTSLKKVSIHEGITNIPPSTFYGCTSLESVTVPDTVTEIGNFAYSRCTNLQKINIPNEVTEIGQDAFSHCKNLTTIKIPSSVKSIGMYAFKGCTNLTATIPKYSLIEHSFIDYDIKYQYSDESVLSVEPVEAYDPTIGFMYYKVTNTTEKTLYNIDMERLLLDSAGDQIEGNRAGAIRVLNPNESKIITLLPVSKPYSELRLIFSNTNKLKYKNMNDFLSASLEEIEKSGKYCINVTSTSPFKIDSVDVQIIFYKDKKIVSIDYGNICNMYKGITQIDHISTPSNNIYDNYTIIVSGYNNK